MQERIVAGIVAEYNPFHNGHAHQIEATRAAGATHIVAVMGGNFIQRGGPACACKFVRANAAVACGVDLVLELPLPYAMATAERFAFGALSVLGGLGIVDVLSFGSECGELPLLCKAAEAAGSAYCSEYTKNLLAEGIPYARARQRAVETLYGTEVAQLLESPNNILAIEYLLQIGRQGLKIAPFTLRRVGSAHDDTRPEGRMASASHLRNLLDLDELDALAPFVPPAARAVYRSAVTAGQMPFSPHSLNTAVLSTLRALPAEAFKRLPDISEEGLDHRLYEAVRGAVSLDDLLARAKTKRYALSRIRRLVWSAYLGVPADLMHLPAPYLRVLSFSKRGMELLTLAGKNATLPLSHSLARLEELGGDAARFAQLEAQASDLFALGLPTVSPCGSDYRNRISVR